MGRKHGMLYLSILIMLTVIITGRIVFAEDNTNEESRYKTESKGNEYYIGQKSPDWEIMKRRPIVKGIYMTGNTASVTSRFNKLVALVKDTELNALVIDVKDDDGFMTYRSNLANVSFAGANSNIRIKNMNSVMKTLRDNKIYPIARVVAFKDTKAGNKFPQLAIRSKDGGIWRDRNGTAWLNPYNSESWRYIVAIAEEAALKGFKEVQFDYVRFPTDGDVASIDYGASARYKSKERAIADFLTYAKKRLSKKGIVVSADVFGLVTAVNDGMHIGQHLETIAKSVDVICPMVYPSHYAKGSYGVDEPDFEPYKIVNKSVVKAKVRIAAINGISSKAKLRPWLQDFTASYLPRYKKYGPAEVRAQIKAANDAGVKEWILWNAGNNYTRGALK